jgi:hypothetical protein
MISRLMGTLIIIAVAAWASDNFKELYKNEKGNYWIFYDYERLSDICKIEIHIRSNIYSCFTDYTYRHRKCDTIKRPDLEKTVFDSVQLEIKKTIAEFKYRDNPKKGICRVNGFGYITNRYSFSCTYSIKACDTCKYGAPPSSNSCLDSNGKSIELKMIERITEPPK